MSAGIVFHKSGNGGLAGQPRPQQPALISDVQGSELQRHVEALSFPRNFEAEPTENRRAARHIAAQFQALGYNTSFVGEHYSVLAHNNPPTGQTVMLVGAHFDGVAGSPGADDNASAISGMLVIAKLIKQHHPHLPIVFCGFNCEEDGLLGSSEVASILVDSGRFNIGAAHIFEMLAFSSKSAHGQAFPHGINPGSGFEKGNFITVVGTEDDQVTIKDAVDLQSLYLPQLPVLGVEVRRASMPDFGDLLRSDHVPFWDRGIPAIQWTDTANFRNRNYHTATDTPETLDYDFFRSVVQLALLTIVNQAERLG